MADDPDDADRAVDELQRDALNRAARQTRPTVALDPRELTGDLGGSPSWALVSAALERAAPAWGPLAVRLGVLALLVECCHAMARPDAPKALIANAQDLLDALNKMSWER